MQEKVQRLITNPKLANWQTILKTTSKMISYKLYTLPLLRRTIHSLEYNNSSVIYYCDVLAAQWYIFKIYSTFLFITNEWYHILGTLLVYALPFIDRVTVAAKILITCFCKNLKMQIYINNKIRGCWTIWRNSSSHRIVLNLKCQHPS